MRAEKRESMVAWSLVLPAAVLVLLVALFPLGWTFWASFHMQDHASITLENYRELLNDTRFWGALANTAVFTVASVVPELVLGTAFALLLNRAFRCRGPLRAVLLVPWIIPTVVAALLWRFMFDGEAALANAIVHSPVLLDRPIAWFSSATGAWVPIVAAEVWRTTPFVMLLVLAALQNIEPALHEAARIDGAGAWSRFVHLTLPELRPVILLALIFRTLDAFRVFDLIYVMTGGGPRTSTEPIALYTFNTLFPQPRFGYGAALSVIGFLVTGALAALYVRALGGRLTTRTS
jgi:ABC-type sugar transport system permease subunit